MKKLYFFVLQMMVSALAFQCQAKTDVDPLVAFLVSPPAIFTVTPQIGTPTQNNLNAVFPATEVVIKGENFGLATTVRFNEIVARIISNFGTELRTVVPDNAYSGVVTVSKSGGSCLPGLKTGTNCIGTDFFIDCYAVTNKQYGDEIEIKQGESKSITFDGIETKAFHTNVIAGGSFITVTCDSIVTLRVFDRSCQATDYILQKDPRVAIPGNSSSQFYLTAGSSTCAISI
ncbi:LIC10067 family putative lipoprotein [Leptospira sp. 'Mane']|uniref:LIC10067 family putative lipoprotein n=1 Tax=Leptospira sp. 'Mane' TaxID=3387407 RepID=UPI00398AC12A